MKNSIVVHVRDGRVDRVVADDEALRGVQVAAIDGEDATLHWIGLETEIGTYVARARAGSQLHNLRTAAELAAHALSQIARTAHATPEATTANIIRVQQQLCEMCEAALELRAPVTDAGAAEPAALARDKLTSWDQPKIDARPLVASAAPAEGRQSPLRQLRIASHSLDSISSSTAASAARIVEIEATEPSVGKIERHLLSEPALGADAVTVADDERPDQQLGIDRGLADMAVIGRLEGRPRMPESIDIQTNS